MDEQFDNLDFKNQLELFQSDLTEFTALMHISLEGIRTDSVDPDEVRNSFAMLYQMTEILSHRMKDIQQKFLL